MRGTPSISPERLRPSEGGGSDRGGGAGQLASKEDEAEGRMVGGTEGRVEPERAFLRHSLYGRHFKNASHCATDQSLQISQVTSAEHLIPLATPPHMLGVDP